MKNAKRIVVKSITFLVLIIVYSCNFGDKKEPCPECPCPEVGDEAYDKGIIFPDEARKLYVNYENRRVPLIQDYEDAIDEKNPDYEQQQQNRQEQNGDEGNIDPNGDKFDVARYVWYDYQDLKNYLAYIENEAKLSGEELSTLRFYFANYPDEEKFPDGEPVVHRRQNSIMMSPTVNRDGSEHIFYTEDAEAGKRKIVLLENNFKRKGTDGSEQEGSDPKSEASLAPAFLSPSSAAPVFAARSTTKNEGNSAPPPH